jgi:hypothetical protein
VFKLLWSTLISGATSCSYKDIIFLHCLLIWPPVLSTVHVYKYGALLVLKYQMFMSTYRTLHCLIPYLIPQWCALIWKSAISAQLMSQWCCSMVFESSVRFYACVGFYVNIMRSLSAHLHELMNNKANILLLYLLYLEIWWPTMLHLGAFLVFITTFKI